MFRKKFLITISFIAFGWILFLSYQLLFDQKKITKDDLFNQADEQIWVIHPNFNFQEQETPFAIPERIQFIYKLFTQEKLIKTRVFISKKQNHLLFELPSNQTLKSAALFLKDFQIETHEKSSNQLESNAFEITVFKNWVYLKALEMEKTKSPIPLSAFDRKATYSILNMQANTWKAKDFYLGKNEKIIYQSHAEGTLAPLSPAVNDQSLFSAILPKNITSYHFYEKSHVMEAFPSFEHSKMNLITDKGIIVFTYNQEKVMITDLKSEINPEYALQVKDKNEPILHPFLNEMLGTKQKLYVYTLDDFLIISKNKTLCGQVITDYKTGNTLALNPSSFQFVYGQSPSTVHERWVNKNQKKTLLRYKNHEINATVYAEGRAAESSTQKEEISNRSVELDGDFKGMLKIGNNDFLVLTEQSIYRILQNKIVWRQQVAMNFKEQNIVFCEFKGAPLFGAFSKSKFILFDRDGKILNEKVIETNLASPIAQMKLNAQGIYLYTALQLENGQIVIGNSRAENLRKIDNTLLGEGKMHAFHKNSTPYLAYLKSNGVYHFDLSRGREALSYQCNTSGQFTTQKNEASYYFVENQKLIIKNTSGHEIDQIALDKSFKLLRIKSVEQENYALLRSPSDIAIVDLKMKSVQLINRTTTINENIDIETHQGKKLISFVNPLENNISLYDEKSQCIHETIIEGEQFALISKTNQGLWKIATEVERFFVQYELKRP